MSFLNHLISGISLGSIYAIIALGYTMVYGIAKMLNFAHGDVIMVGGYMCFCATTYLRLAGVDRGVVLAVVVCTALGVVIERLAYKPLRMAPSLAVLITAIGVSLLSAECGAADLVLQPEDLYLGRYRRGAQPVRRSDADLQGDARCHCGVRCHHGAL